MKLLCAYEMRCGESHAGFDANSIESILDAVDAVLPHSFLGGADVPAVIADGFARGTLRYLSLAVTSGGNPVLRLRVPVLRVTGDADIIRIGYFNYNWGWRWREAADLPARRVDTLLRAQLARYERHDAARDILAPVPRRADGTWIMPMIGTFMPDPIADDEWRNAQRLLAMPADVSRRG